MKGEGCRERLGSFFIKMWNTEGNRGKNQSGLSLPALSSRMCPRESG